MSNPVGSPINIAFEHCSTGDIGYLLAIVHPGSKPMDSWIAENPSRKNLLGKIINKYVKMWVTVTAPLKYNSQVPLRTKAILMHSQVLSVSTLKRIYSARKSL
jgi:hypothetical protein